MDAMDGVLTDCPDCGVEPGELHMPVCDVERCPACGGQYISCGCEDEVEDEDRIKWSGEWPGAAECREFGWYAKRGPVWGWVPCGPDEPGSVEDLNRLHAEAKWDKDRKRFVLRKTEASQS